MFQLANGGTIFLDEVGEMSPPLQVKLLRVCRTARSARSARTAFKVDVPRDRRLEQGPVAEVEQGRFREDLFYRLQVIPIRMPPLRERRSDIPLLIQHFLEQAQPALASGDRCASPRRRMVHLWEYDWPGNVRELENLIERLVILADGELIDVENLPPSIRRFISEKRNPTPMLTDETSTSTPRSRSSRTG